MDISLDKRIESLKGKMTEFGIDHKRLATYAERNYVTISRVLNGKDERYATESNISALEGGLEKILNEYRQKLCGK